MPVAVAVDSSACLPADLAAAWGVEVAPLQVAIGDVAHEEGSVGPSDVVDALRAGATVSTSQPSVGALERVVEAAGGAPLVFVALSSELSGTVSSMTAVAAASSAPVEVVDSRTLALAAGLAALSAASVAREGGTADAVAAEARRVAVTSACVFTVETLEYLRRGGRVSAAAAAVGDALGVRPVLAVADGRIDAVARVRTTAKSRDAVVARIVAHAAGFEHPVVGIMTLPGDELAGGAVAVAVREALGCPVVLAPLSAALAAHGGPGTVAVAVADVAASLADSLT